MAEPDTVSSLTRTILYIDDDESRHSFRRSWLESYGLEVVTASTHADAMLVFESQPIAAVILDYSMPNVATWLAAAHARRVNPRVPKILLADDSSVPDDVAEIIDALVPKTGDPNELMQSLESLIKLRNHSHPELEKEYVAFVNSSRRYTDCSDGVCRLLGHPRMKLLNMTIEDVSYRPERTSALFERYVQRGAMDGQYILKHRSGKPVFIQYNAHVFSDGCMAAVWEPIIGWKGLYQSALLEFDSDKLKEQIEVAETAIRERMRELAAQKERSPIERQEIDDAISGLRVLRREIRS